MALHFGEHITIDGYHGSYKRLDDKQAVLSCLNELCSTMKMHPLDKPRVYHAPDNHMKDPGGWSAFVVIAESHISIHTFPRRRFLSADVYTCQNGIDADFLTRFFKRKFLLKDVETHFVKRGTRYPAHNIV
jgi:S-adenosylmethionine decarboxylase